MTDNGSAYVSVVHALACKTLRVRHLRTRPYRPRTNGKAERFIRTMLAGWPTAPSTALARNDASPSPAGSTITIAAAHTAASATNHPYSGWRPSRGTTLLGPTASAPAVRPAGTVTKTADERSA